VSPLVEIPERGRTYAVRRQIRLSDMDVRGRLRLDAVARFLQDAAIDDVQETGWGLPEHVWFVRWLRIDVEVPFLDDREVEILTWCSGVAAIAAGRRWSVRGDREGRIEVDSVWIHLGPDARPARLENFEIYAEAAGDRRVSTKLDLPDPPATAERLAWPLRATDIDLHGHVNNAVHWQAVEQRLFQRGIDMRRSLTARLDYGDPLEFGDTVELAEWSENGAYAVAFVVGGRTKACARVETSV
jgi:acyl-ACP thioesterase